MVRLATIVLAIIIPGFSVIPTLLVYILLGYLLPETDEFQRRGVPKVCFQTSLTLKLP